MAGVALSPGFITESFDLSSTVVTLVKADTESGLSCGVEDGGGDGRHVAGYLEPRVQEGDERDLASRRGKGGEAVNGDLVSADRELRGRIAVGRNRGGMGFH
jgi:hypothetical protein